jgi:hypothetical protein
MRLVEVMQELQILVRRMNETVQPDKLGLVGKEQIRDFIQVVDRMKILLEELEILHLGRKHGELRWNPELEHWFCVRCGRSSDHLTIEDARKEMDAFACELPSRSVEPASSQ